MVPGLQTQKIVFFDTRRGSDRSIEKLGTEKALFPVCKAVSYGSSILFQLDLIFRPCIDVFDPKGGRKGRAILGISTPTVQDVPRSKVYFSNEALCLLQYSVISNNTHQI